ncbi:restriction endonuclease subunit S [Micromonospora chalcea]|uniref:restriction endonuclease subunit S n=1 Tax=Micromonospora chalcea TaxID=1874 RepID=UPI000CE54267|nr:restriction endonuclease subunit S [Micromonospora chalcea]
MTTGLAGVAIPAKWEWRPLKHVTESIGRGTAPDYVEDGQVWAVSQAANQAYGLDWRRARLHAVAGDPTQLKGILRTGDVLLNSTGRGTLGRVGFFSGTPDSRPAMADSHVTRLRAQPQILHPRFAYYYLLSEPFQHYISSALVVGATNQIELVCERLAAAPIPVPPLEEQRRIVDFLDAELARFVAVVERRVAQRRILEERVQAVISEELMPGILAKGQRDDNFPWLPVLPVSLPLVRLGYISRLQSGLTVNGARQRTDGDVTLPYLRVANVQAGRLSLDSVTEVTVPRGLAERSKLQAGDVLMTEGGDLDKLGRGAVWRGQLVDCLHQNHVFAIRCDKARLDPEYLAFVTRSIHGRCYFESTGVRTTNLASTNSSKILDFPIPLPTLVRQREIVVALKEKLRVVEQICSAIDRQVLLLHLRRQALVAAAVTGRLDVQTAEASELA